MPDHRLVQGPAVYALTREGAALGFKLGAALGGDVYLPRRLAEEAGFRADGAAGPPVKVFEKLGRAVAENFHRRSGHLFICATGLAVRLIAPLLEKKTVDPAVVVMGQDGRFAVSLLSGHLGGANALAVAAAEVTGGQAVINTATDLAGLPALEMLARDLDLHLENFIKLPALSRVLVEGGRVGVYDPGDFLWPSLAAWPEAFFRHVQAPERESAPLVWVDYRLGSPPASALVLRPKVIALGLGCHRGIDPAEVEALARESLAASGLSLFSVAVLATVETRAQEPAFLELSRRWNRPLEIFTKDQLGRVSVENPSETVLKQIGVASVCEAAAILAARMGPLLIKKRKSARATLAAALTRPEEPRWPEAA